MSLKSNYDVIVVGSGTGGAAASKFLAQRGLSTLMLDRQKAGQIHKICGDATSAIHFKRVTERDPDGINKIATPGESGELHQVMKGFSFFTPKGDRYDIPADGDGWIIARDKFTARLINEAIEKGVEYFDNTTVRKPIVENDTVKGVNVRTKEGEIKDIRAKVVVDASGMAGIIRRQLDENKAQWDSLIRHYDLAAAFRELIVFKDYKFERPDHIELYFDTDNCPGGYFWIFPRGDDSANVGIGLEPRKYEGGPRAAYDWWIKHLNHIFGGKYDVIHKGGWNVPLRRPMDSLVYNGVVLIGDAGSCVKATDGGGIGLSLISGSQCANPIARAIEEDNFSTHGPLWDYNVRFMRETGAHEAPLALAKSQIVKATNKELNTIFDNEVITAKDLYNLNSGLPITGGLVTNLKRAWRGRSILPFLKGLQSTMGKMKVVKNMYLNYPETPEELKIWRAKIVKLFDDHNRAEKYYTETGKRPAKTTSQSVPS
jgi:geranylgeranyl reductase family protein